MTDPKLPPLPFEFDYARHEREIEEWGEACYRAGQSSAEALTEAGALARALEIAASRRAPVGDQSAASKLWMLLDDIDTLDDACRDDDRAFRDSVRKIQQKRFEIMEGPHTPPKGEQKP